MRDEVQALPHRGKKDDFNVGAVVLEKVCVKRDQGQVGNTLEECSLKVKQGELCVVTGPVGCGKVRRERVFLYQDV